MSLQMFRLELLGLAGGARTVANRWFSVSPAACGGVKSKRKKQGMRMDNPHLPVRAEEKTSKTLALNNFDQYYSQYYGRRWNSMRLGLLSRPKYCAVVNNFGETEETVEKLENLGCVDVTKTFNQINKQRLAKVAQYEENISKSGLSDTQVELIDHDEQILKSSEYDDEDEETRSQFSLRSDKAMDRYIDPEEKVIGDMSSSMYDFVPTSSLKGMEDFVEETDYYNYYKTDARDSVPVQVWRTLNMPQHLRVFVFPRNVMDMFPPPRAGLSQNLNYYCMDGGSIFPVLALDLRPGQDVLDMCSAPGGKALMALQTLYPKTLVCNDVNGQRLGRVGSVMEQYCGVDSGVAEVRDTITFSRCDGAELLDYGAYDRVLCDVPCFSDRHSVSQDGDNLFAQNMTKHRLKLPEEQCALLKAGLMYLRPGGSLVYSTCTLSPVQNEGVVNMALKALWEETQIKFFVCDLSPSLKPFKFMCRIFGKKEGVNLGNLVVPNLSNNFGPTYFCKIDRKM